MIVMQNLQLGVICLEEILNEIIQIDSIALENKNKNEDLLIKKKQEYEEKIINYRNEKLNMALKNAQSIYDSISDKTKKQEESKLEKTKKISLQIEKKYMQIEEELVHKIMKKLFEMET